MSETSAKSETPAVLEFSGCEEALLFTREIQASYEGVLARNRITDPASISAGAFTASIDGRPWHDTVWFRDNAAMLRELIHWGRFDTAKALVAALRTLVVPNAEGFWTCPMYTRCGERGSGHEWDGTALSVVGAVLLWERLPAVDPFRRELEDFLLAPASPVRAVVAAIARDRLVAGSGEFGGGLGLEGLFFNVVQNAMIAWMLELVAARFRPDDPRAGELTRQSAAAAGSLKAALAGYFVAGDGTWTWALDPATLQPSREARESRGNQGFGGINAAFSHTADVHGFRPMESGEAWLAPSLQTFWALLARPQRLAQFARHGMWTQFDLIHDGFITGPSYGQGYALQAMLLMDRPELYTPAANWLARATFAPEYAITRDSPYWFYERYYSPDDPARRTRDEGCGALNLVCVAEPLKVARLMAGMDDHADGGVEIVPRLPVGWTGLKATSLPVRTAGGHARLDFEVAADGAGRVTRVRGQAGGLLPALKVRLGTAAQPQWLSVAAGAAHFDLALRT